MHPPKFDYYRANSLSEAFSLLQEHSGAKVIAGGHSLVSSVLFSVLDSVPNLFSRQRHFQMSDA